MKSSKERLFKTINNLMTQDDTVRIFGVSPFVKRIKMGSGESHFNVSLIVRDKVTRQCPQTTISDEKGEPKRPESNRGPSAT